MIAKPALSILNQLFDTGLCMLGITISNMVCERNSDSTFIVPPSLFTVSLAM